MTKWLKAVGETIARDEPLFEVSTDKVDSEVPSPAAGVLAEIRVPEGDTVDVGTVLAVVSDGAAAPTPAAAPAPPAWLHPLAPLHRRRPRCRRPRPRPPLRPHHRRPRCRRLRPPPPAPAAARARGRSSHGRGERNGRRRQPGPVPGRPSAPRRARSRPVGDPGYGPRRPDHAFRRPGSDRRRAVGRSSGSDAGAAWPQHRRWRRQPLRPHLLRPHPLLRPLLRLPPRLRPQPPLRPHAAPAAPVAAAPVTPAAAPSPAARAGSDEIVPFTNIRRRTAEHMVRSKATSAHTLVVLEADYENVERVRRAHGREFRDDEGFSLTYLPFVARACVEALHEWVDLNSSVGEDALIVHHQVNLGIAVDLDHQGLIVPVVPRAEELTLRGLARRIHDLATRARTKKLTADDISGGTFSITNAGPFGTFLTAPIINQPQVAILSTDGVKRRPVVVRPRTGRKPSPSIRRGCCACRGTTGPSTAPTPPPSWRGSPSCSTPTTGPQSSDPEGGRACCGSAGSVGSRITRPTPCRARSTPAAGTTICCSSSTLTSSPWGSGAIRTTSWSTRPRWGRPWSGPTGAVTSPTTGPVSWWPTRS